MTRSVVFDTQMGSVKMAFLFQAAQKMKRSLGGISSCVIRGQREDVAFPQVKAAAVFQPAQKLIKGFRRLSTCVIRGTYEDVALPGYLFEPIMVHAARCPMLAGVGDGLVIPYSADQPFQITDHWRQLLYTGLVQSVICSRNNDSVSNAFDINNVGVIEHLNTIAFRRFERVEGVRNTNHSGYCQFVGHLFNSLYPLYPITQLPELHGFLSTFHLPDRMSDNFLMRNPFFLGVRGIADFNMEAHRLIRHQFQVRGMTPDADDILTYLAACYGNEDVARKCDDSVLLAHLLGGAHCGQRRATSTKLSSGPPSGSTVMDLHRNVATHCIEFRTMDEAKTRGRARTLIPYSVILDRLKGYTWEDVIRGLRYMFPLYPNSVALAFADVGLFDKLHMDLRLPVPSIHGYTSPQRYGDLPVPSIDGYAAPQRYGELF